MFKRTALLAVLLLSIPTAGVLPAGSAPKGTPLSGAQLHALLDDGVMLDFTFPDGTTVGSLALLRNGLAYSIWRATGGTGGSDKGNWRIESDRLCLSWTQLNLGNRYCVRYFDVGGNRYEVRRIPDDALLNTVRPRR